MQGTDNAMLWLMNETSFRTQCEYPTLLQVAEGNTTWLAKQRVLHLSNAGKWVYMVIHSPFAQAHPMHLHGHDFWVLTAGDGNFRPTIMNALTFLNAPRRDAILLPSSGYVVIAMKENNPGVSPEVKGKW